MKKFLTLVLGLALALSLAGCGGGQNAGSAENAAADNAGEAAVEETGEAGSDAAEAGEAGADAAEAGEADAAEAGEADAAEAGETGSDAAEAGEGESGTLVLNTVEPGKLTMSTNAAFPPYEMTTDAGGFEGIDVETAEKIAEKLGLTLNVLDVDFDAALLAVQNGKSDIAMAGITVREDRLAVMDFSDSYATGVQVVIVKEGSDITLENMGEHQIGTQRATTGNIYCTEQFGESHVVAYDNGMTAVQALKNGQIDCVVIDNAPAKVLVSQNPGLAILDTEYVTEDYAIAVGKGNTDLLNAVNAALAELKEDGTLQGIMDKYITAE